MRRDRRSDPFPMRPCDEPPPSRWERVGVWLEFGGFAVLTVSGLIACGWGALRYVAGWS